MVEREAGNRDGMEGGKESAHWALLEIMEKPRGYLEVSACHWRTSSCKRVTYGMIDRDILFDWHLETSGRSTPSKPSLYYVMFYM